MEHWHSKLNQDILDFVSLKKKKKKITLALELPKIQLFQFEINGIWNKWIRFFHTINNISRYQNSDSQYLFNCWYYDKIKSIPFQTNGLDFKKSKIELSSIYNS